MAEPPPATATAAAAAAATTTTTTVITLSELKQHKQRSSLWIAINDQVYDVTEFLTDHPGGVEILLDQGGGYATKAFEAIEHSAEARELMKKYCIGSLSQDDKEYYKPPKQMDGISSAPPLTTNTRWISWQVPLLIAVSSLLLYKLFFAADNTTQ